MSTVLHDRWLPKGINAGSSDINFPTGGTFGRVSVILCEGDRVRVERQSGQHSTYGARGDKGMFVDPPRAILRFKIQDWPE